MTNRGNMSGLPRRVRQDARRWKRPVRNPARVAGHDAMTLRTRIGRGPYVVMRQPWSSVAHSPRVRLALLLPIFLFVFSLIQNLGNMQSVDFHRDEARWINRASFLGDLRDPFGETWADYYTTRGQPPLGNYLMGAGLLLQGRDLDTNRVWDFSYDEAWNASVGAYPEAPDLLAGRRTNAAIGAIVVVAVYAITTMLTNPAGGLVAGLFLSFHPLHVRLSSQALSDELLALTIVASFIAAFRFTRMPSLGSGLLLGAMLGLGGAAKLSPLLMSIPLAALGGLWLVTRARQTGRRGLRWRTARFGWLLLAQPAIAFGTFVAVNPFLWPNPIGRTLAQFDFRRSEMEGQSAAWPVAGVDGPLTALARTGRRFDSDYSSTIRFQDWLERLLSVSFEPISLDVLAMTAGTIVVFGMVVRQGMWSPPGIVAVLMAGQAAIVVAGMGVDFYRYFLPLLVIGAICIGSSAGSAVEAVHRWRVRGPAARGSQASNRLPLGQTRSGYNRSGIGLAEDAPSPY